ncbi:helix-turn-helix DNA binding domain protein [Streptomyces phage Stigma]|nr:helix-turn-helix DNA binding domain protein [Streptomyces phage Stigma]
MAKAVKKYLSEKWLYRQHVVLRRSPESIAEECGVAVRTIYRKLEDLERKNK